MTERPRLGHPARVGGDGDPVVFAADEQSEVLVDLPRWAALAEAMLRAEGVRGHAEVSLLFVETDEMSRLNEQFMDSAGPTDVLAFPIDAPEAGFGPRPWLAGPDRPPPDPSDEPLLLGDVVVCPAIAVANAPTHAGTVDDELALLVVHGLLHVLGHDHALPDETARMRARELALLEELHWRGPAPAGFRAEQD